MSTIVTVLLCLAAISLLPVLFTAVLAWFQEITRLIGIVFEERSADAVIACSVSMALSLVTMALIVHLGIKYLM